MRTLRSLAFGIAVVLTMVLLLVASVSVWAFSRLLDPPALARTVATALEDPAVRGYVSRQVGAEVATAVLDLGPLPAPVRRVLGVPARPTEAALTAELAERIDGLLADEATGDAMVLAAAAFAHVVGEALGDTGSATDWAERGLVVDLTPLGRLLLDRLDPSGALGGALPASAVTIRLLDGAVMATIVTLVRSLDTLRWALLVACLAAMIAVLVLARFRVHALAWVGLCGVVAGTVSLLVASGVPVLLPRTTTEDPGQVAVITAALDGLTGSLVTQSAVLAGLGLALVVAGIAGGVVVAHGDSERDARHGWDPGRLS